MTNAALPSSQDSRARSPWPWLLAILLIAPLAVSGTSAEGPEPVELTWPRVHIGDEPHYLVMINSLIADGDLDLANNYANVHRGLLDAGAMATGHDLDHHVKWYVGDRLITWHEAFLAPGQGWRHDHDGHRMPTLRPRFPTGDGPHHEYSWHPPGLPLLLAPLVYPLRGTIWVERAALFCSGLVTLAAMLFFHSLLAPYASDDNSAWAATALAFLGTPAWYYGRALFCEAYLLAFAVGAYALVLRRDAYFTAGTLLALGVLMKPPFAVLAIPLAVNGWLAPSTFSPATIRTTHKLKCVSRLFVPIGVSVFAIALLNQHMYGAWYRTSMRWESGDLIKGTIGLLFSYRHGLMASVPAMVAVAAAWPLFFRLYRREAVVLATAFAIWFVLMACWLAWDGGACYGPRMIVPVIPLAMVPAVVFFRCAWWNSRAARAAVAMLVAASVATNAVAAFCPSYAWRMHPWSLIARWICG
jgi:hypothetical protein